MTEEKCIIQLDVGDGIFFLDRNGLSSPDLQSSMIFPDLLAAHVYIDKHGLNRLAKVRVIK